nr:uncharacterized protein LOC129445451 [Misgurnus anguillicaudatus]
MAVMPPKVEDLCEERESETSTINEPSSVAVDSLTEGNSSVAETLEGCIVHQVVSVLPSACEPLIFEVAHAENEKKVSSEPPALSGASPQSQESEATKESSHQEVSHLSEELATKADPDDTVEMTVDSQEDSEPSVVPEPQAPSSPPAEPVCAHEEAVVGMKTALIQNRVDIIRVSGARVSALFGFEVGMNLVHFPQTSEEACKLVRQAMFVKMMNLHQKQDWGKKLDNLHSFIRRFPSLFFIREPAGHIVTSPAPMAALQYEEPIVPVLPLPASDHEEPIVPVLPLPAPDHEEPIVPVLPLPAPDHDEPIVLVPPLPAPTSALDHEVPIVPVLPLPATDHEEPIVPVLRLPVPDHKEHIVPVSPLPAPTSAPDHEDPAVQVLPSPAPVAAVNQVPVLPLPAVTTLDHKDPTVQVVPLPALYHEEPLVPVFPLPASTSALDDEEPIMPVLPLPAPTSALTHEEPILPVLTLPAPTSHLDHERPIKQVLLLPPALPVAPYAVWAQKEAVMGTETDLIQNRVKVLVHKLIRVSGARVSAAFRYKVGMKLVQFAQTSEEACKLVRQAMFVKMMNLHQKQDWGKKFDNLHRFIRRFPSIFFIIEPHHILYGIEDHENPLLDVLPPPAQLVAPMEDYPIEDLLVPDTLDPSRNAAALEHEEPAGHILRSPAPTSAWDYEEPILPVLPLPVPDHEEPIVPLLPLPAPTTPLDNEEPIVPVLPLPASTSALDDEEPIVPVPPLPAPTSVLDHEEPMVPVLPLPAPNSALDHEEPIVPVSPLPAYTSALDDEEPIMPVLPLPAPNSALDHEEPIVPVSPLPAYTSALDDEEPIMPVLPLPAPNSALDHEEPIVPVSPLPAYTSALDDEEPIMPVLPLPVPTSALAHEEPILPVLPLPVPTSALAHERPVMRVLPPPPALPVAPHAVCAQKEAVMGTETDLIQNRVDVLVHDLIRVSGARVSAAFRCKVGMKLVQFAQTSEDACKLVRQAMFVKMMNLHRKQDWGEKLDNLQRFIRRFPSIFFIIEPHHILYGIEDHENPLLDVLTPPAQHVAPMEDYPIEDLLVPDPLDPSGNAAALEHEEPAGHILRSPAPMAARDYEEPILPVLPLPVPDHEEPIVPLLPLPAPSTPLDNEEHIVPLLPLPAPTTPLDNEEPIVLILPLPAPTTPLDNEEPIVPVLPLAASTSALDDEEPIVSVSPLPAYTSALDDEEPIVSVSPLPAPTSALDHVEPILPVLPLPAHTSHLDHERTIMRVLPLPPALPVAPHAVCAQKEAVMGTETDLIQNRVDVLVHDLIRVSGARVSAAFRCKVGMKLVQFAQTSEEACKLVRQAMFVKMMNLHRKQDWGKKLDNLQRFIRRFPSIFFIIEPHHILYGIEDHENPLLDVLPPPAQHVAPMEDYPIEDLLVPDPLDPSGNAAALEHEEPAGHILRSPAPMAARDYEEPILPVLPLPVPDHEEPIVPLLPLPAPSTPLDNEEHIVPLLPLPAPTTPLDNEEPIVLILPLPAPTTPLDNEEPIVPVLPLAASTSALDDEEPIVSVSPLPAYTSALDHVEPILPVLSLPAHTSHLDHERTIMRVLPLPPALPVAPHAVCAQKEAVMGTETDLIQNRVDVLVHDLIRVSGARVSAAFRYKVGMKLVQFAQTSEEACKLVRQAMFVKMMNLHRKQDWGKKLDNLHSFIRRFPSIFFIIEPHHILYGIEDHENPLLDVLPPPAQLVAPMEDYPIKNRLVPDPVDPIGSVAALEQEEPAGHILHSPAVMAAWDYEEPILPILPLPVPDHEEPIVPLLPLPAPTSALDHEEAIVPLLPLPAPTSALDHEEAIVPLLPLPAPTSALDHEEPIVLPLPLPAPTSALDHEEAIVPLLPLPAPTSALDHEEPIVPLLPLPAPTSALDHEEAIVPLLPLPAPTSALDHEEPIVPVLPLPAPTSALDHEEPIMPVLPLPASTSALDHEEPIVPVLPLPASTSALDHEEPTFQVLTSPAPVASMVLLLPALPVAPHAQTPLHKRRACAAVKQKRSRLCSAQPQHSHPPVWLSPTKPSMTSSHKRRAPHQLQPHNAEPEEEMEVESSYVAQNPSPPVWPPQTSTSLNKRFASSTLQPHNANTVEEMEVESSYVAYKANASSDIYIFVQAFCFFNL